MDTKKMHKETASWEQHKNATCYVELIQEAAPNETTAVWSLTSYLKNYPGKMNKTCGTLLENQGRTYKMDVPVWADQQEFI